MAGDGVAMRLGFFECLVGIPVGGIASVLALRFANANGVSTCRGAGCGGCVRSARNSLDLDTCD